MTDQSEACGGYDNNIPYQIVDPDQPLASPTDDIYLYRSIGDAAKAINSDPSQITDLNLIPYVVDYSGPSTGWVQPPTPRPFYCSRRNDGTYKVFGFYVDSSTGTVYYANWYFFYLPDYVTIETSQVYVELDWNWSNTTVLAP